MSKMFKGKLKKVNGVVSHIDSKTSAKYQQFMNSIKDNEEVDVFMEVIDDDGSLAQLAKIHKTISILARHTGNSFIDMKLYIKDLSGLCVTRNIEGKELCYCKSFGDCSKEELNSVIETIINKGAELKLDLS